MRPKTTQGTYVQSTFRTTTVLFVPYRYDFTTQSCMHHARDQKEHATGRFLKVEMKKGQPPPWGNHSERCAQMDDFTVSERCRVLCE